MENQIFQDLKGLHLSGMAECWQNLHGDAKVSGNRPPGWSRDADPGGARPAGCQQNCQEFCWYRSKERLLFGIYKQYF